MNQLQMINRMLWVGDVIPTDTLIHYKFDNNLSDSSLTGNNGVGAGSYTYVTDRHNTNNGAISFTNGIISTSNQIILSNTDKVSFSFWVKFTTQTIGILYELSPNFNYNNAIAVAINNVGTNKIDINDHNQGYNIVVSSVDVNNGTWKHIIMTSNRSEDGVNQIKIYVNNVLATTVTGNRNNNNGVYSDQTLYIGARSGISTPYNGALDDFRVYPRILTSDERTLLYNE